MSAYAPSASVVACAARSYPWLRRSTVRTTPAAAAPFRAVTCPLTVAFACASGTSSWKTPSLGKSPAESGSVADARPGTYPAAEKRTR